MENKRDNIEFGLSSEAMREFEAREKDLIKYQELIRKQEKQLDDYRAQLKQEQLDREKQIQRELHARERFFADREKKFFERQENLQLRQNEIAELKNKLKNELAYRESQLQQAWQSLKLEKERYTEDSRKKIELKSKDYVSETIDTLNQKEIQFHLISKVWSGVGAASLILGLCFFTYVTVSVIDILPNPVTWEFITFSIFKGLIAVVLFAALAKYALLFSNSYMREALKNADRRHAINFGKFYLESYGSAADWTQVKEAFEHWNITGTNAFYKPEENQLDITALEKVATVIEKISKTIPNLNKDKN